MDDTATPPVPASGGLELRYAALSDVGRVRKNNQDSGFASPHLLVVADGVGGAARGDIASSTAVQILRRLDEPPPADTAEALAGAIHRAHDRLAELVDEDPELDGTSTTITAALFDGARITVGHVGDSRGYLLRDGTLSQLTKDHTFVQSLIDEGRITEEESRTHPHRNLILRAVDGVHDADPDLFAVDLAPGDRILLCSDGCSGVLDPDRIADILGTGSVDYAVVELVRAALEAGSSDNVTVIVADVVDAGAEEDTGAAATTGPMLVGAAAEQPRRTPIASKSLFRGHRGGDTGEIEPVPGAPAEGELDPEALRYAPRPPKRYRWVKRLVALAVLLGLLVAAAAAAYGWSQRQYYVAFDGDRVAVYRGIASDLPWPRMNRIDRTTEVTRQSLPTYHAAQVSAGIPADDPAHAQEIIDRLTRLARKCPEPEAEPKPEPEPSPSPTRSPKDGTADSDKSPTPEPSPSPTVAPPECIEAEEAGGS
ncbi:MAG: PP2C family protein-serine/threonine phosphatase [Actinomycetes bacterium]